MSSWFYFFSFLFLNQFLGACVWDKFAMSPHSSCMPCVLQLRVIRAFKSTLEDLEERRSIHSLRSSRSRPLSDITFIDEEPGKAPCFNTNSTLTATFGPPILKTPTCDDPHRPHYCEGHSTPYLFYTLPKIPYETSI